MTQSENLIRLTVNGQQTLVPPVPDTLPEQLLEQSESSGDHTQPHKPIVIQSNRHRETISHSHLDSPDTTDFRQEIKEKQNDFVRVNFSKNKLRQYLSLLILDSSALEIAIHSLPVNTQEPSLLIRYSNNNQIIEVDNLPDDSLDIIFSYPNVPDIESILKQDQSWSAYVVFAIATGTASMDQLTSDPDGFLDDLIKKLKPPSEEAEPITAEDVITLSELPGLIRRLDEGSFHSSPDALKEVTPNDSVEPKLPEDDEQEDDSGDDDQEIEDDEQNKESDDYIEDDDEVDEDVEVEHPEVDLTEKITEIFANLPDEDPDEIKADTPVIIIRNDEADLMTQCVSKNGLLKELKSKCHSEAITLENIHEVFGSTDEDSIHVKKIVMKQKKNRWTKPQHSEIGVSVYIVQANGRDYDAKKKRIGAELLKQYVDEYHTIDEEAVDKKIKQFVLRQLEASLQDYEISSAEDFYQQLIKQYQKIAGYYKGVGSNARLNDIEKIQQAWGFSELMFENGNSKDAFELSTYSFQRVETIITEVLHERFESYINEKATELFFNKPSENEILAVQDQIKGVLVRNKPQKAEKILLQEPALIVEAFGIEQPVDISGLEKLSTMIDILISSQWNYFAIDEKHHQALHEAFMYQFSNPVASLKEILPGITKDSFVKLKKQWSELLSIVDEDEFVELLSNEVEEEDELRNLWIENIRKTDKSRQFKEMAKRAVENKIAQSKKMFEASQRALTTFTDLNTEVLTDVRESDHQAIRHTIIAIFKLRLQSVLELEPDIKEISSQLELEDDESEILKTILAYSSDTAEDEVDGNESKLNDAI